jgi:hypothetical protein
MPITPEYADQLQQLHAADKGFGNRTIRPIAVLNLLGVVEPVTVLDYGCGKASWYALNEFPPAIKEFHFYDPGVTLNTQVRALLEYRGYKVVEHLDEDSLQRVDFVICRHVMEHIEPDMQEETWGKLFSLFDKTLFIEVGMGLANAHLPDGRNAHISHFDSTEWFDFAVKSCFKDKDVHLVEAKYVRNERVLRMIFARGKEFGEPQDKMPRTAGWRVIG